MADSSNLPPNSGETGPTSQPGPVGQTNTFFVGSVIGPTGATGFTGSTGSIGPTGATGATGSVGATGPSCFAAGTSVRTMRGDITVERIEVGDHLPTFSGRSALVEWVGNRRIDLSTHPRPDAMRPIRIAAGAFNEGQPSRPLLLSPEHAVYMAEIDALVPIRCLVNGATIAPCQTITEVDYYHIELDGHDILFAEGLATESWLDTGNRAAFSNAAIVDLFASFELPSEQIYADHGYARLLETGAEIDALRVNLARRAEAMGQAVTATTPLEITEAGHAHGVIPAGTSLVRLICASAYRLPDKRRLGALITRIEIDDVELPLDSPRLKSGFHECELHDAVPIRWTNGDAIIDLGDCASSRALTITVAAVTHGPATVAAVPPAA